MTRFEDCKTTLVPAGLRLPDSCFSTRFAFYHIRGFLVDVTRFYQIRGLESGRCLAAVLKAFLNLVDVTLFSETYHIVTLVPRNLPDWFARLVALDV